MIDIKTMTKDQLLDPALADRLMAEYYEQFKKDGERVYKELRNELLTRARDVGCLSPVKSMSTELRKMMAERQKQEYRAQQFQQYAERAKFLNLNSKGDPIGVNQNAVYEHVIANNHIMVYMRKPYVYDNGAYYLDNDGAVEGVRIKSIIADLIAGDFRTADIINKIYARVLQDRSLLATSVNTFPKHWINFENGMYDVMDGTWHEHSPEYRCLNQIPHEYHPEQQTAGDKIEEFLNFALYRDNARELLLEYMGYSMTISNDYQKFLMLRGEGGNGKSVIINLLDAIIGAKNEAHISMSKLCEDKFAVVQLLGKLVNSCGDLKTNSLKDVQKLKEITGKDGINGEYKGKDSFSMPSYAKLIFSTNEIPRIIGEESDAVYRRMMVLTMDRKPEKVNVLLEDELKTQLPYLMNLMVEALKRLLERGEFIHCQDSEDNVEAARNDSNSVDAFLAECCEREAGAMYERTKLYEAYKEFCADGGRQPKNNTQFYSVLRNKGMNVDIKTKGIRYVGGVTLKQETEVAPVDPPKFERPYTPPAQMKLGADKEGNVKIDAAELIRQQQLQIDALQQQVNQLMQLVKSGQLLP